MLRHLLTESRINSKGINGSARLTAGCVLQWVNYSYVNTLVLNCMYTTENNSFSVYVYSAVITTVVSHFCSI